MCPICLVNLPKAGDGMRFRDISDYLVEASTRPPGARGAGVAPGAALAVAGGE